MKRAVKKFPGSPFGVGVERFLGIGYHPGFEVRPGTFKYPEIFPGCYEKNQSRRIVSKIPRWERQLDVEEYSRRLGFHGDEILKLRLWMNSVNGPGWQDLPSTPGRRITFPRAVRFPVPRFKAFSVPGPGTYGKNHVPYTRIEEKNHSKGFSHSILAPFERSSLGPRSLSVHRSYHLPPNLYHVKNSIDEFVAKKISKRGPYDLFSGERFPDLPVTKMTLLTQKLHPSDLKHPKNVFKGKFLRCGKESRITSRVVLVDPSLAYKDPFFPGPSHYDPYPALPVSPASHPFNSSVKQARPTVKRKLQPPPGRYNHELKKRIKGDGLKSAFLSKTSRALPQIQKHSWFE